MNTKRYLGIMLVLGLAATACGDDDDSDSSAGGEQTAEATASAEAPATVAPDEPSGGTITIGAVSELSGNAQVFGIPMQTAFDAAVANVNAAGGIEVGGQTYTLESKVLDNGSDPAANTAAAQELLEAEPIMVMGADINGLSVYNVFKGSNTVFFGPDSSVSAELDAQLAAGDVDPKLFTPITLYSQIYENWAKHVKVMVPDLTKVAVVVPESYAVLGDLEELAYGNQSVEVAHRANVPDATTDFSAFLNAAAASEPDLLVIEAISSDASEAMLRQAIRLDVAPRMFMHSFPEDRVREILADEGASEDFQVIVPHYGPVAGESTTLPQYTPGEILDGRDARNPEASAVYYYSIMVTLEAMKAAGTVTDADAIAAAMIGLSFDGPMGTCTMTDQHWLQCPNPISVVQGDTITIHNFEQASDDTPEGVYDCTDACVRRPD